MPRVPQALRKQVVRAANNRCEYCLTPQELTLASFHVDHIIPKSAGGATEFENLSLSCPFCNQLKRKKCHASDPETGSQVRLFNLIHVVIAGTNTFNGAWHTNPW